MNQLDDRTELLIESLVARARRAAAPEHGQVEIGKFIEDVHSALREGCDFAAGQVSEWHVDFSRRGCQVHESVFAMLHALYSLRNMSGHSNPNSLSREKLDTNLQIVRQDCGTLLDHLQSVGLKERFVETLYQRQNSCERHRAARELVAALNQLEHPEAVVQAVETYVYPLLAHRAQALRQVPSHKRLERLVAEVARLEHSPTTDHLRRLADQLLALFAEAAGASLLKNWCAACQRIGLHRVDDRFPVIRATLEQEPGGPLYLTDVTMLWPRLTQPPPPLPTPVVIPAPANLFQHLNRPVQQLISRLQRERPEPNPSMEEFVLQLQAPSRVLCEPFEDSLLSPKRLSTAFHCFTVTRREERNFPVPLPGNIAHPELGEGSLALKQRLSAEDLHDKVSGQQIRCVFAAHDAWRPESGLTSPVVEAFDGFGLAVLDFAPQLEESLEALFGSQRRHSVHGFLRRVTEVRRQKKVPCRVLWDDARYNELSAEPL